LNICFIKGYGEYFFKDVPLSAEEHFNDLARGEMAKKKVEKPTHEFWRKAKRDKLGVFISKATRKGTRSSIRRRKNNFL